MRAIDVLSSSLKSLNDAKDDSLFNAGSSEQPPEFDVDVDTTQKLNHGGQLSNVSSAYEYDALFKMLVIGDKAVGKTSVVRRLLDGDSGEYRDAHYVEEQKMHLQHGMDFKVKRLYMDDKSIELHLYDIIDVNQTQLSQHALLSYIDNVNAILLVFDLRDKHSFNSIKKTWLPLVHGSVNPHLHKVIIANQGQEEEEHGDIFQSPPVLMPAAGQGGGPATSFSQRTRDKYERMANDMGCDYFQLPSTSSLSSPSSSSASALDILESIVCALCEPKEQQLMDEPRNPSHPPPDNALFLAPQPYHPYRGPPNSQRTIRRDSGSSYTMSLDRYQMVSSHPNGAIDSVDNMQSKVPMYADTIQEEDSMHYSNQHAPPFPERGPMFVREIDDESVLMQTPQRQHVQANTMDSAAYIRAMDTNSRGSSVNHGNAHDRDAFALAKQKITIKLADGVHGNSNKQNTMRLQQTAEPDIEEEDEEEEEDDEEEDEDDDSRVESEHHPKQTPQRHSQHQQYKHVAVAEDDEDETDDGDTAQGDHGNGGDADGDGRPRATDSTPFKYEYSRKLSAQGLYSLNELRSSSQMSCKTFCLMFAKVLLFPFTMLYQLLLFHHNNDDKLINIALRSHLPLSFDVYDAKMRIFYDLQDAFLRGNYFDHNVLSTEVLFDSTDFLRQSTKQIVVRFACICVGLLLFVLMMLNLIWFGLHHRDAPLHAMECLGAVCLWLLYAVAVSLWVCVECAVKHIDKRPLARLQLLVHQNKYDTEAVTTTSVSRLLRYIEDKRARERDVSSVYRGACMEIVCLSLALCYALLPSFARTSAAAAAFIPSDSVGVGIWLISLLTNYIASLLLVRLCLISVPRTFERIAYLNASLTCLVSMSHQNEDDACGGAHAVFLPFLNVMNPTNIASFQQLRNYVFLCCAQKMKSIEVLVVLDLLIFMALCVLLLMSGAQSVYRWMCCFWIAISLGGLLGLFRTAYAMQNEGKQQSKELLSQTLFVNHQIMARKYKSDAVISSDYQKRADQDSKHAAHILHSVRLLIAYLDANPVTPMLWNVKLYHAIAGCVLFGCMIILIAIA